MSTRPMAADLSSSADEPPLVVDLDGTFTVTNARNGFSKTYKP